MASLASLGSLVRSNFRKLSSTYANLADDSRFRQQLQQSDIDEEFSRFQLWSSNIALTIGGHASLDYRLRQAPTLEETFRGLLLTLSDAIQNLQAVLSSERLPFEEQSLSDTSDSDEASSNDDQSSRNNATDDRECPSRLQTCRSTISRLIRKRPVIGKVKYCHDPLGLRRQLELPNQIVAHQVSYCEELSSKVKTPARRIGGDKVLRYRPIDPATGADVLSESLRRDKLDIEQTFGHARFNADQPVDYLFTRLASASFRRRQQLLYWKHQKQKRLQSDKPHKDEPHVLWTALPESWVETRENQDDQSVLNAPSLLSGPSTATAAQPQSVDAFDLQSTFSGESEAETISTSISDGSGDGFRHEAPPDLPAPPTSLLTGTHFECPICFTLLGRRFLKPQIWRNHVIEDLRPYVCTYSSCPDHDRLFSTREEWENHEGMGHRPMWRCSEHSVACTTSKDFEGHIKQEHQVSSEEALLSLIKSSKVLNSRDDRRCPLCSVELEDFKNSVVHLAHHLECVAAFSLSSADLPEPALPTQDDKHSVHCESCNRPEIEDRKVWLCVSCGESMICDDCWDKQLPHRPGRTGADGLPHEKTSWHVVQRLRNSFNPPSSKDELEDLHRKDRNTIWFGISRDKTGQPVLQDFRRLSSILNESEIKDTAHLYPQIVSFIGQTGAGKSTLIKMLIEREESKLLAKKQYDTPIISNSADERTPLTGDVHLYADPATYSSYLPLLYADCEGLDGGERLPVTTALPKAMVEKKVATDTRDHPRSTRYGFARKLEWATDGGYNKALTRLYPRLLYVFSNTVVFVVRNARTFEVTLEQMVDWASAASESVINQPTLPNAVIVLNATDLQISPDEWDSNHATQTLLKNFSYTIEQVPKFARLAEAWRKRGFDIKSVEDILLRYFASIRVVRIPTRGRYILLDQQLSALQTAISTCANYSYFVKRNAGLVSNIDDLRAEIEASFEHFSSSPDQPFDFLEASKGSVHVLPSFSRNVLALIRRLQLRYPGQKAEWYFETISQVVGSSIVLDYGRRQLKGPLADFFPGEYKGLLHPILSDFCQQNLPCSFAGGGAYCINKRSTHHKGHQNVRGEIIGPGAFQSNFDEKRFLGRWYSLVCNAAVQINSVSRPPTGHGDPDLRLHLTYTTNFYKERGGAASYMSNTTCLCCLLNIPQHPLTCGHALCSTCAHEYAIESSETCFVLPNCPLHPTQTTRQPDIKDKPSLAGVRVLSLDSGGIRNIVQLEVLRAIELALGGHLQIQTFFDLIIGTSTGGIVALDIGTQHRSIEQCISNFMNLCNRAFTARRGTSILPLRALAYHSSKYRTRPLNTALQDLFHPDTALFSSSLWMSGGINKVGVISTSESWEQAIVLANYNREVEQNPTYYFERPEDPRNELKIWEVARATSATPTYFKPFINVRTRQGYVDGSIHFTNPVEIAFKEQKLIWPENTQVHPDILLSVGTGHHGETSGRFEALGTISMPPNAQNRSDRDTVASFGDSTKSSSERSISRFTNSLKPLSARFDSTNATEETWQQFRKSVVPSPYNPSRHRYRRINPDLGFNVPRFDELTKIMDVRNAVRKQMERDLANPRSTINHVAQQLIASSFYLHVTASANTYAVAAIICCRFDDSVEDTRKFGQLLETKQRSDFQPCFAYEKQQGEPVRWARISTNTIQTMIDEGRFLGPELTFDITEPGRAVHVNLHLTKEGEPYPISGFPRVLV